MSLKRVRTALYGLALLASLARTLLPFLLTTYLSFRIRRRILLGRLVRIMKEKGVPEEHAKVLAEGLLPDPLGLIRGVTVWQEQRKGSGS